MDSREATLKALGDGKKLTSIITGIQYKLINGHLYSKNSESKKWKESGLSFFFPNSWLSLKD